MYIGDVRNAVIGLFRRGVIQPRPSIFKRLISDYQQIMSSLSSSRSALKKSIGRATAAASVRCNSTRFYSSTMHENDPETLELEKNRNLRGIQHKTSTPHAHAPGWNEHLASASEASIKADQSSGSLSELQSRTIEYLRTRHADGEDSTCSTTAFYSRDEVSGPLSGAKGGKEDVFDLRHDEVTVSVDKKGFKEVVKTIKEELMTPSEQDVKADRGEI